VKVNRSWPEVGDNVWDAIRSEFGLYSRDEFEDSLEALYGDTDPVFQKLIRVFVGDETLFPGFQFPTGLPDPTALALFAQAMELGIPHNVFAAWMVTPLRANSQRPVDGLEHGAILAGALDDFAHGRPWVPPWASVPVAERRPAARR
jgi:hypothetical protein